MYCHQEIIGNVPVRSEQWPVADRFYFIPTFSVGLGGHQQISRSSGKHTRDIVMIYISA
jgi:hypothetical protein